MRVRFPSPAPLFPSRSEHLSRRFRHTAPGLQSGSVPHMCHTPGASHVTLAVFRLLCRLIAGFPTYLANERAERLRDGSVTVPRGVLVKAAPLRGTAPGVCGWLSGWNGTPSYMPVKDGQIKTADSGRPLAKRPAVILGSECPLPVTASKAGLWAVATRWLRNP